MNLAFSYSFAIYRTLSCSSHSCLYSCIFHRMYIGCLLSQFCKVANIKPLALWTQKLKTITTAPFAFLMELQLHTLLILGIRWGSVVTALPWLLCTYPVRYEVPHSWPGTRGWDWTLCAHLPTPHSTNCYLYSDILSTFVLSFSVIGEYGEFLH